MKTTIFSNDDAMLWELCAALWYSLMIRWDEPKTFQLHYLKTIDNFWKLCKILSRKSILSSPHITTNFTYLLCRFLPRVVCKEILLFKYKNIVEFCSSVIHNCMNPRFFDTNIQGTRAQICDKRVFEMA